MELRNLNNDELLRSTKHAVAKEKEAVTNVTRHFQEIMARRLFLPKYASMFEMLRNEYGYCAGSAQIRINAIRLIQDIPIVKEKIESGEISMSVAANIQSFFYAERKSEKLYSETEKLDLVNACSGKSVLEAQKEFAKRNPELEKREVIRQTSEDRLLVSHSLSNEVEAKLQRIKLLWSHVDPSMSRETLLNRMADLVLSQIDPEIRLQRFEAKQRLKNQSGENRQLHDHQTKDQKIEDQKINGQDSQLCNSEPQTSFHAHEMKSRSRHIPNPVRRKVFKENRRRGCEFVDPDSGRRCGSQFQTQFDHVEPFSRGGEHVEENLRILCAQHNLWRFQSEETS